MRATINRPPDGGNTTAALSPSLCYRAVWRPIADTAFSQALSNWSRDGLRRHATGWVSLLTHLAVVIVQDDRGFHLFITERDNTNLIGVSPVASFQTLTEAQHCAAVRMSGVLRELETWIPRARRLRDSGPCKQHYAEEYRRAFRDFLILRHMMRMSR